MKMKVSELQGPALDWAVAKCEGTLYANGGMWDLFCPSTDWEFAGPIIEREKINLENNPSRCHWIASTPAPEHRNGAVETVGLTPLIAAMRCYVASKLGDIIEIPEAINETQ